ncbi:Protein kinase domain [Trypanosoma melophagium]|uniref:Protein kinase domain n=1 Tax=Trypanosoma melophagium TaxID=715481 RepID=UPI003519FAA7|nr:Protein kinase domain [Trypanosoma melophagium]
MTASHKQIVGKYELGKVLAAGEFDCRTRLCTHIVTGAQYVVRIYDKGVLSEAQWMWNRIRDAIHVMRTLPKHENIIETAECFETQSLLYILMQYFAPMHLTKLYTSETSTGQRVSFPLEKTKHYYAQVVRGLVHMHERNVVHLGIAPDHIMVNDRDQVKIGYLVSCMYFTKGKPCRAIRGTTHTVAPEVLRNEGYDPYLADAWSMGVLLYFMLHHGRYPHDGANTTKNIMYNRIRPPDPSLPPEARELITWLMHPIPSRRLRVEQILTHPFFLRDYGDTSTLEKNSVSVSGMSVAETDYSLDPATGERTVNIRVPYGLSRQEEAAYIIQHTYRAYRARKVRELERADDYMRNRLSTSTAGSGERLSSAAKSFGRSLPSLLKIDDVSFLDDRGQGGKLNESQQQRISRVTQLTPELPHFEEPNMDELGTDEGLAEPDSPNALGCHKSVVLFNNTPEEGNSPKHAAVQRGPRRSAVRFSLPSRSLRGEGGIGEMGISGIGGSKIGDGKGDETGGKSKRGSQLRLDPHACPNDNSVINAFEFGTHIKVDATRPCPLCNRLPMQRVCGREPYNKTSYVYRKGEFTLRDDDDDGL